MPLILLSGVRIIPSVLQAKEHSKYIRIRIFNALFIVFPLCGFFNCHFHKGDNCCFVCVLIDVMFIYIYVIVWGWCVHVIGVAVLVSNG